MPDADAIHRWLSRHRRTCDMALAAGVLAAFEMPAFDPFRHDGRHWWPFWGLLIAGPLLWRRSRPIGAFVLSMGGASGALLTRSGPSWGALGQTAILVGPAAALASSVALLHRSLSTRLALAAAGVILVVTALSGSAPDVLVAQLVMVGGAWVAGEAFRARRHEILLLEELLDHRAEDAAAVERTRIARDLHDVVAHQLAVIAIQAGAARLGASPGNVGAGTTSLGAGPAQPTGALLAIEHAAQVALTDLRRALGVLRSDDDPPGISPQPGLELLDDLTGRLRQAGLPVELTTVGDLTGLPSVVGVSAYRLVQEALTNVLNHAGAVATHVRVARTHDELALHVRNEPSPRRHNPGPSEGGRGLLGMRERVTSCRGTLEAGPLPAGGFAVTARFPLP